MDLPITDLMDEDACHQSSSPGPTRGASPARVAAEPTACPSSAATATKRYLHQCVAMFEWGDNVKRATMGFIRALLGVEDATECPHEPPRGRSKPGLFRGNPAPAWPPSPDSLFGDS